MQPFRLKRLAAISAQETEDCVFYSPEIKNSVIKPHFKMLALPQKWVDKAQMNMFSFVSQARRALGSEQPMPDADF
jgi:hypothetical protein